MTTIAWDGTRLVADTRCSSGGLPGYVTKAWRLPDGRLFGGAGTMAIAHAVYRWLAEGGVKPKDGDGFCGILITRLPQLVRIELIDDALEWYQIHVDKWAIGSGRDFAIAAMALGKDARAAVELAATFDLFTGLPLIELTL